MKPIVHKFGGASLADPRAVENALGLVRASERPAVVVVSAFAGVTDALRGVVDGLVRGDDAAVTTTVARLRRLHERAARAVTLPGDRRRRLVAAVRETLGQLEALTRAPRLLRELSPHAIDRVLATGEELAARIFPEGLSRIGVRSELVSALEVVATDGRPGQASPDLAETDRRARSRLRSLLARGIVPVVPGFFGADDGGRVVTFGRGGSDLTATLLARALNARAVHLWKDVPGFLTADPTVVSDARVIPQLHVREAAELAYYGAKVLHPRALIPLGRRRIPIFVRPFENPDLPGTEISARRTLARYPVKALSAIPDQSLVTVTGNGMLGVPGIAARTFAALHEKGISISLISQASSEHSICLTVPQMAAEAARASLAAAFREEIARRQIDGVETRDGLATISVVGLGMAGTPGIAARVFGSLSNAGINVVAIAQGSSELNISFVVDSERAAEAQRRIHRAFQLSKIGGGGAISRRADVVLLGFGQVGRTLARLVAGSSRRANVRLAAVIDRGGYLFASDGLSPRDVARLTALKSQGRTVADAPRGVRSSPEAAIAALAAHALSRPILVDVTADDTVPLLEESVAGGFDVVLANKRPLSGRRKEAEGISAALLGSERRLRFEATVGAGLPILDTHRKLVESGDRILRIDGCLSGTLGFLLSEVEAGRPFSEALRRAMERGYTEPDPRDDLSGADVGRKALILGRLIGFEGEPSDVAVESLVPARMRKLALATFLGRLAEMDEDWAERFRRARSRNRALRYIASVTRRTIRVGLVEVPPASPFARLRGTDNQVAFTTRLYRPNPLVIQGPGAGLAVTAAGIFNDVAELAGE